MNALALRGGNYIWFEHFKFFFAKIEKIIIVVCMKLYNILFMLVLIGFPHSSFSSAKMGGDFSEDYFKKFEIVFPTSVLELELMYPFVFF